MRNTFRDVFDNYEHSFKDLLKARNKRSIKQLGTKKILYPTVDDLTRKIYTIEHVWKFGDKFYKLAYEHYAESELWWLIAWFNQKPTEFHVNLGEVISIPFPVNILLEYFGF